MTLIYRSAACSAVQNQVTRQRYQTIPARQWFPPLSAWAASPWSAAVRESALLPKLQDTKTAAEKNRLRDQSTADPLVPSMYVQGAELGDGELRLETPVTPVRIELSTLPGNSQHHNHDDKVAVRSPVQVHW